MTILVREFTSAVPWKMGAKLPDSELLEVRVSTFTGILPYHYKYRNCSMKFSSLNWIKSNF